MGIAIEPSGQACGATVHGLDLSAPLSADVVDQIRRAWLEHHVLSFPGQSMDDDDLERFTRYFGRFGDDPFIRPIPGRDHVIAVHRAADETAPVFAEAWHSDWSFQEIPPAGTCLFGIIIPPTGGDTLFVDQHAAYAAMPDELRRRIDGRTAIHSAGVAYGRSGTYGERDADNERAMDIIYSDEADATQRHPLVCRHPESGKVAVFSCLGYIAAIEGLDPDESRDLLLELYRWQGRPEFQYRHGWEAGTLLMWDNRSVLHMATGGYDGHERLLHRTTIAGTVPPTAA